ncbi:hypothetical protein BCR35DRAFT_306051 [Leucosporidium creatinivorum]|uniref:Uncharacterized protein n=1 Tax=Leucosporidium creatinivorum TaxID=106004 RepID=A0A1Y2EY07_9BASI|nr:hypothetical protein BCR35DRAFT_306051 [Leucosporidium creatinivorum]
MGANGGANGGVVVKLREVEGDEVTPRAHGGQAKGSRNRAQDYRRAFVTPFLDSLRSAVVSRKAGQILKPTFSLHQSAGDPHQSAQDGRTTEEDFSASAQMSSTQLAETLFLASHRIVSSLLSRKTSSTKTEYRMSLVIAAGGAGRRRKVLQSG